MAIGQARLYLEIPVKTILRENYESLREMITIKNLKLMFRFGKLHRVWNQVSCYSKSEYFIVHSLSKLCTWA